MQVKGKNYKTVWMEGSTVFMIEQNKLPFSFQIFEAKDYQETCNAIKTMITRGAGAIGTAAGFAMAQAFIEAPSKNASVFIEKAKKEIENTRPTARNLFYAVNHVYKAGKRAVSDAIKEAQWIADKDISDSRQIGVYGNKLIKEGFSISTHCNAGWLAFVDYGTALSPIYTAYAEGKKVFVFVNETRPRNQGTRLTAWELNNAGIPHKIIPDNACAYLMSLGKIDMMIVGADRIAANGDVANKIGTLEKAIAAKEYNIPFYVAAPTSTIDINCKSGEEIPIEERNIDEVLYQTGPDKKGIIHEILVASPGSEALNLAFDITPSKYITGIITEKGIIKAEKDSILKIV
ncbi:S-methyl-5-thioribose-1-phosphate isomerase [candidate division KSB1 bacterium]